MGGLSWKKVAALKAGLEALGELKTDFLGVLDSDVTFAPAFFETLMARMQENPTVGVGGCRIWNSSEGREWPYAVNPDGVGGPVQLFRRTAWDDIGGYIPWGHEDVIAQMMARMHGWKTTSFDAPELKILHLKTPREKGRHPLRGRFYAGRMDRAMRNHPMFQVAKCLHHFAKPPMVIGSIAELSGFAWAAVKGVPCQLPDELVSFNQREQMSRLKRQVGLG
jgi:biofilm PGA synthesis N-glycosyltransferase PgaC